VLVVSAAVAILPGGGCTSTTGPGASTAVSSSSPSSTSAAPTTAAVRDPGASSTTSAGAFDLAALVIDDRPTPDRPYVRDEWPHWADVDGDGCDGRQQALREHSRTPAQIDVFGGCTVVAGDWL